MAEQTQKFVKAARPATMWVQFLTSQAGFRMDKQPDGTLIRGSLFSFSKGDKVEKDIDEAEKLIEMGTCKACKAPVEEMAA
jgi:hypothetical protein